MTSTVLPTIVLILLAALSTLAQGLAPPAKPDGKLDKRPAQELFEDANGYVGRRYQEFNKRKLAYDPKLEAQTKKEQKELASKCKKLTDAIAAAAKKADGKARPVDVIETVLANPPNAVRASAIAIPL